MLTTSSVGYRLPTHDELVAWFGRELLAEYRLPDGGYATPQDKQTFALPEDAALPEPAEAQGLRVAYHALSQEVFHRARLVSRLQETLDVK